MFGLKFWNHKKALYAEQRHMARKGRDLGMLGGGEKDPVILQSMFMEKAVCEKSRYVVQVGPVCRAACMASVGNVCGPWWLVDQVLHLNWNVCTPLLP